ncbi:MAG: flagellar protein FliT [Gammaproteobacteria bacterium]|nr:flagellar protein FliT [Gammaproteobacteria bacterium]
MDVVHPHVEQLQAVLELSHGMLRMALAKDWHTLASLEESRRRKLEAFFAVPVPAHLAKWVGAGVAEILEMDKQIIAACEAGRREAADAMRQLHQAHHAVHVYESGVET